MLFSSQNHSQDAMSYHGDDDDVDDVDDVDDGDDDNEDDEFQQCDVPISIYF